MCVSTNMQITAYTHKEKKVSSCHKVVMPAGAKSQWLLTLHVHHKQPVYLKILVHMPGCLFAIIHCLHGSVAVSTQVSPTEYSCLTSLHCLRVDLRHSPWVEFYWSHGCSNCRGQWEYIQCSLPILVAWDSITFCLLVIWKTLTHSPPKCTKYYSMSQ